MRPKAALLLLAFCCPALAVFGEGVTTRCKLDACRRLKGVVAAAAVCRCHRLPPTADDLSPFPSINGRRGRLLRLGERGLGFILLGRPCSTAAYGWSHQAVCGADHRWGGLELWPPFAPFNLGWGSWTVPVSASPSETGLHRLPT